MTENKNVENNASEDKDVENIMLEEDIINKKMKQQRKSYKNPNSKALTHKIEKIINK